ncbi:MAG: acyltransferase, partial [Rhizobiales bacterium]|nr:acyltransferase [Hyphomicrobiales bacterium]
ISGFLITGILLREYSANGRIDFAGFWARRARRILPAATLVVLTTAAVSLILVSPLLLRKTGKDIFATGFFGLNWRSANDAVDYLAPSDPSPVLHYWSLAVEEQFYLVWPLVVAALFFVSRRSGMRAMWTLAIGSAAILVASFAYCVFLTPVNQPLAFFGTFTRVWQLLAGAFLAIVLTRRVSAGRRLAGFAGPLGLAAILAGFFLIDPEKAFPGLIAAVPVVGAAALIFAGTFGASSNWGSRLVSIPPLAFAGRISYVWYLWHWPILFFGAAVFPEGGLIYAASLVGLSFAAAVVTHHAVENPIRFLPVLVQSRTLSLAMGAILAGSVLLAGHAVGQRAKNLTVTLSDGRQIPIAEVMKDKSAAYQSDCHVSVTETQHGLCIFGKQGAKPEVVLFGDSHAAHFFDAVNAAAIERNTAFLMRSKSGCRSIDGAMWYKALKRRYTECDVWREGVIATIRETRPKLVILAGATRSLLMNEQTGGPATEKDRPEIYRKAQHKMITKLLKYADQVILIKDTPTLPEEPLVCLYRNPGREEACSWPEDSVVMNDFYAPDPSEFGDRVRVIDLNPDICDGGACRAISGGNAVFYDQSHLTASYSMTLMDEFEKLLIGAGL